jgi:ferredoxin like protein
VKAIDRLRRHRPERGHVAAPVVSSPRIPAWPDVAFEDRMATVEFRVSPKAHIVVDGDRCNGCSTRDCVVACPANLFVPTSDGGILFNYEQCFECGTCYMVCNTEGAISWQYPEGGHGVVFRHT